MKKYRVRGFVVIPTAIDITVNAYSPNEATTKILDQFPSTQDYSFSITEEKENDITERNDCSMQR